MVDGKYLGEGRALVYLDQCVISRFLEASPKELWEDICALLLHLCEKGKIVCPVSLEHLVETAQLCASDIERLAPITAKLSGGWTLRAEPDLIAEQLMGNLRGLLVTKDAFLRKNLYHPLVSNATRTSLRNLKSKMDRHNEWLMSDVNYVNSLTRQGGPKDPTILAWMRSRRHQIILSTLLARLQESIRTGLVRITADPYRSDLAQWDTLVLYNMIEDHRLALPEAIQLVRLLRDSGLALCPTLLIKAEMDALQFAKQEKIEAGDQYDITHAACALPYADIYVTDGGKAAAIKELKLDIRFKTKVFSTKRLDRAAFLEVLKALLM